MIRAYICYFAKMAGIRSFLILSVQFNMFSPSGYHSDYQIFLFFIMIHLIMIKIQLKYYPPHNFNNSLPAKKNCQLSDFLKKSDFFKKVHLFMKQGDFDKICFWIGMLSGRYPNNKLICTGPWLFVQYRQANLDTMAICLNQFARIDLWRYILQ